MQRSSQKINIPQLQTSEQIILESPGAYKDNFRSGWKAGRYLLTNQRFMVCQRQTIGLEIPLGDIIKLAVERLHYVIRKKRVICLFYKAGNGARERKIWFVVNDLEEWRERIISQTSLFRVDLETVEKIAAQSDPDSQDILWHLWEKRHARIDQLAELVDAPSHMHVLLNIRETINPIAEKIVGIPILSFESSKLDPETGEKILFSWWLMGQQEKCVRGEVPLLDIFDEGPFVQVIMEVKGTEASDLRLKVERDRLTVRSENPDCIWKEVIQLPAEVNADEHQMQLRNNFLEIKLLKR